MNWTDQDAIAAMAQGWGITYRPNTGWQIARSRPRDRTNYPPQIRKARFKNSRGAVRLVGLRAADGDPLAMKAVAFVMFHRLSK